MGGMDTERIRTCPAWERAFIAALAEQGVVARACESAGIGRVTAYDHRKVCSRFAADWANALETFTDTLEAEAVRRARDGWNEPVYYQGEVCGAVQKFSDTLLQMVLRANRPDKYREKVDVLVVIRAEARRMAEERGLDAATLIAEAERIATGQAAP